MSSEYRFLRFEVVGIATIVFLLVGTAPLVDRASLFSTTSDAGALLAVLGALFLISLPLGYWEHQLVVNVYRSHKKERRVFRVLKNIVSETEKTNSTNKRKPFFDSLDDKRKNAFLTSLLDVYMYTNSSVSPEIFNRLSDRWSHFYARRAIGSYAPAISLIFWVATVILGYLLSWPFIFQLGNFVVSILWWIVIFILCHYMIGSYAEKLWEEIGFLEESIVLANEKDANLAVSDIILSMMEHPDYYEKDDSYGGAVFRF